MHRSLIPLTPVIPIQNTSLSRSNSIPHARSTSSPTVGSAPAPARIRASRITNMMHALTSGLMGGFAGSGFKTHRDMVVGRRGSGVIQNGARAGYASYRWRTNESGWCELSLELADVEYDIGTHEEPVGTRYLMLGDCVGDVLTTTVSLFDILSSLAEIFTLYRSTGDVQIG